MEREDYIKKWLEGTLTEEEQSVFRKTEDYAVLRKLSESLKSFRAPEFDVTAEYERLKARKASMGKTVAVDWFRQVLKVAAVLFVLAGSYFFFLYDAPSRVETLAGKKTVVVLPDSSVVALNALSSISFDEKQWERRRRVKLKGEGFFKVAKGSSFDVVTAQGTVTVLGTSFNVSDRSGYFEVVCFEGSVQVQTSDAVVRLSPGQLFQMIDGIVTRDDGVAGDQPDWSRGESSFESVPFVYVVAEFERQYDVTVTTRNVDTRRLYSGVFTHSDFIIALKSIALPFNLEYEVEGKKIILTGDH